jgi:hypothetical protein
MGFVKVAMQPIATGARTAFARDATLSSSIAAAMAPPANALTRVLKYAVTVSYIAGRSISAVMKEGMNGRVK